MRENIYFLKKEAKGAVGDIFMKHKYYSQNC